MAYEVPVKIYPANLKF